VLISRTCEEPTRLTLKAVFTVPAEARCFQLRFAAPVAEVTLD
jgi:hypothetical protein